MERPFATGPTTVIAAFSKPLSFRVLKRLAQHVTGDSKLTKYRSGPELVSLFNTFGCNDLYGQGFSSRWKFAEDRLQSLNGTTAIMSLIETVFDPLEFKEQVNDGDPLSSEVAVADMNEYLRRDGVEIALEERGAKVRKITRAAIAMEPIPAISPADTRKPRATMMWRYCGLPLALLDGRISLQDVARVASIEFWWWEVVSG